MTFRSLKILIFTAAIWMVTGSCDVPSADHPDEYDLVIYGGTSGGVIAAVQAARMGRTAIIIEPGNRLGGATSGNLGWADIGEEETIPRLPESMRNEMLQYGLPKDEYMEDDHWTPQLYIRETRRMIGEHVLVQQDCQVNVTKEKSIGLASYGPDSHHVQRIVYNGEVVNEGNFLEPHKPYEIPLGVILPKREECKNLLVPVCVSSSHIAFGSIRMEPVFMIMGQAAATVAVQALKDGAAVQDIDYEILKKQLLQDKQRLKLDTN